MKRGKKNDAVAVPQAEDVTPAGQASQTADTSWDGPTRAGSEGEIAELAAESAGLEAEIAVDVVVADAAPSDAVYGEATIETLLTADGEIVPAVDGEVLDAAAGEPVAATDEEDEPAPAVETPGRLESIIESLLYAAERPLTVNELKRLVNERDAKKLTAALEALRERHADTGIQLASLAGGWQFRTHPENGPWVAKLVAGRPQRLSRAMLETLAIVAYRQPVTRPEIDDIRGVDCGPVLKTLLDRGYVRILGKKEDVGRPMLYGTTPEFLRTFSLKDLSELPTLREFHELSEQQMAAVDAQAPLQVGADAPAAEGATPPGEARSPFAPAPMELTPVDQAEEEELLEALDAATVAATRASGPPPGQGAEAAPAEPSEAQS